MVYRFQSRQAKKVGLLVLLVAFCSLFRLVSFKGDAWSRYLDASSYPQAANLFSEGELDVRPSLNKMCVSFRFRGKQGDHTSDDALRMIRDEASSAINSAQKHKLRVGIMIMEDVKKFFPVRIRETGNNYHLFHYVEMVVIAYSELFTVSRSLVDENETLDSGVSISKGLLMVEVPWIFSPYMAPNEICGGPRGLNCLIADLIFGGGRNERRFRDTHRIIGLEEMEHHTFNFTNHKEKAVDRRFELAETAYTDAPFAREADAVLLVERFGCNNAGINKPWTDYIDNFPAEAWHNAIEESLTDMPTRPTRQRLIVCYIDRQNTDRRLPDEQHKWIVHHLAVLDDVDFRHLHMENYTAYQQIQSASQCDMLIGMHGNGLTHALWMVPNRYVVEFYYRYNFQFDYATTAQLMGHTYLGVIDGAVIDSIMVQQRDTSLRQHPTRRESQSKPFNVTMLDFEEQAKPAILNLVDNAVKRLIRQSIGE